MRSPQSPPYTPRPILAAGRDDVLQNLLEAAQYGPVVDIGNGRFLVDSPPDIQHVLQENARNYTAGSRSNLVPLLGTGLITSDGPVWLQRRRLIQPAFHRSCIAALTATMVSTIAARIAQWHAGMTLDMHAEMRALTLDVVIRTLFGTTLPADQVHVIAQAFTTMQQQIVQNHAPAQPFQQAQETLTNAVQDIIDHQRDAPPEPTTMLSLLLAARDDTNQSLSDHDLQAEVRSLLFAGHETTTSALAWVWYLIAQHPDTARQLQEESWSVLGNRCPTAEDVPQLRYTKTVIEETLRLFPPAWMLTRKSIAADTLADYHIPPHSTIRCISIRAKPLPIQPRSPPPNGK